MPHKKIYRRIRFEFELRKKSFSSIEKAQSQLNSYQYQSIPTFSQHNIIQNDFDLMIVVPVYNAENYLVECIDSIFAQ